MPPSNAFTEMDLMDRAGSERFALALGSIALGPFSPSPSAAIGLRIFLRVIVTAHKMVRT